MLSTWGQYYLHRKKDQSQRRWYMMVAEVRVTILLERGPCTK
jgi:hypothetical protein